MVAEVGGGGESRRQVATFCTCGQQERQQLVKESQGIRERA